MEFLSNKPLLITDTILRDAHQSQAATRMTLEQMLPACEILDSIGYYSLECWGGATFDACLRFLDEDPWERLRQLRAHLPSSPRRNTAVRSRPLSPTPSPPSTMRIIL